MLEAFSILFFGMAAFTLFIVFACFTTFMVPWKTYSLLYDHTDSFLLSFFPAFAAGSIVCYLWILVSYAVVFSIV